MKILHSYQIIKSLNIPIFNTNDIAINLSVSNKYGYKLLKKLTDENFVLHLRRDLWAINDNLDPLILPDYLTSPMPSYISLQSALYFHGIIAQIPSVFYVVSIARTREYKTKLGTYSIHHINPELFTGFDTIGENSIKIAQPEKAIFDFFYLKSTKSKLFYSLPETDIPIKFSWSKVHSYAKKIANKSRMNMVLTLMEKYSQKSI